MFSSDEEFIQEAEDIIHTIIDAETTNFIEIAEIADINLKEDLVGANLSGFDLSNADLSDAELSNVNLSNANLSNADLSDADLSDANLSNANLSNANLSNAYLSNTNLSYADLSYANLTGANLLLANIEGAILKGINVNPSYVKGSRLLLYYLSYGESPATNLEKVNQIITTLSNDGKDTQEVERFQDFVTKELTSKKDITISSELLKKYLQKCKSLEEELRVIQYRGEIEEIENSLIACKEASVWLSDKRADLVAEVRNLIAKNQVEIKDLNRVTVSPKQLEQFCHSIGIYLQWIEFYIEDGTVPTLLPKEIVNLALPDNYYVKVFEFIKNNKISSEQGLSSQAIYELRGYFDRFIIAPFLESNFS
jgi:hypothetical protein